ncbi:MAG: ATP-binding cassette domain-containing protein [Pseudomonadota bacterium]
MRGDQNRNAAAGAPSDTPPTTEDPRTLKSLLAGPGFQPRIATAFGFTLAINLLMLVSPLYMLQVYDRVLTSGSYETLTVLSLIAVFLLGIYGAAEGGRKRTFAILGAMLGERLDKPLHTQALKEGSSAKDHPGQSLSRLQAWLINGGPAPLFDLPFAPLFFVLLFLVHPALGTLALVGAGLLIGLAIIQETVTKAPLQAAGMQEGAASQLARQSLMSAPAVVGLGMVSAVTDRVMGAKRIGLTTSLAASNTAGFIASVSRALRQILQVGALGLGAFLVLNQMISPGSIVAGSILLGRGLQPIDQIVNQWKQLVKLRDDWRQIEAAVPSALGRETPVALPRPEAVLRVENLSVSAPGEDRLLIPKFNLTVNPGELIAVIGESGAGKSSLLRVAAGIVPPAEGVVRLGGVDIHAWDPDDRGQHVGYMPQDISLLSGTVRENIARFRSGADEDVIAAAERSGTAPVISRLAKSFETPISAEGSSLSGGQRQAVGLARAFFASPPLLILDEPTAALDTNLVSEVVAALTKHTKAGGIGLVATHDVRVINACSSVLTLHRGKISMLTKEAYFDEMRKGAARAS